MQRVDSLLIQSKKIVYNKHPRPTERLWNLEWIFPSFSCAFIVKVWTLIRALLNGQCRDHEQGYLWAFAAVPREKLSSQSLRVWLLPELYHFSTVVCSENTERPRKIWNPTEAFLSQWASTLKHTIFDSLLWVAESVDFFSPAMISFHLIIKYNLS